MASTNYSRNETKTFFYEKNELLDTISQAIKVTDTVLEIGCGIAPMNYFRPKLHLMIEPWKEYADILAYRYKDDKSVVIFNNDGLKQISSFMDNSIDSIFLIDVIEHINKEDGLKVIKHCERIARQQVVLFTPLGFMPQHMDQEEKDGWGLSGTSVQEHLSGWLPEEFGEHWEFHICKNFHNVDFKGEPLETVYGAFYAIYNPKGKEIQKPAAWSEIRKPLPSEIELGQMRNIMNEMEITIKGYQKILQSPFVKYPWKLRSLFKKVFQYIG